MRRVFGVSIRPVSFRDMRRPDSPVLLLLTAVLTALSLAVLPSLAMADTTISKVGSVITVTGDDSASALETSAFRTVMELEDTAGGDVKARSGCVQDGPSAAVCGNFAPGDSIVANLGGGVDKYKYDSIDVPQTIDAGAGNDVIVAGKGNDTLKGGPGNDELTGGRGDDIVDGGIGRDLLIGDGSTPDPVDEETGIMPPPPVPGNDKISSRDDEVDTVNCGGGADVATVDLVDEVSSCATVDRAAVSVPGTTPGTATTGTTTPGVTTPDTTTPGTTPGTTTPTQLTVTGSVTKKQTPSALSKGKKVRFSVTSNGACTAVVALVVSKREAKRLNLGTKQLTIATSAGKALTASVATDVKVAIDSKYRTKLAKASKLKVTYGIACVATGAAAGSGGDVTFRK